LEAIQEDVQEVKWETWN